MPEGWQGGTNFAIVGPAFEKGEGRPQRALSLGQLGAELSAHTIKSLRPMFEPMNVVGQTTIRLALLPDFANEQFQKIAAQERSVFIKRPFELIEITI